MFAPGNIEPGRGSVNGVVTGVGAGGGGRQPADDDSVDDSFFMA